MNKDKLTQSKAYLSKALHINISSVAKTHRSCANPLLSISIVSLRCDETQKLNDRAKLSRNQWPPSSDREGNKKYFTHIDISVTDSTCCHRKLKAPFTI